jgi:hypothetical protein
MRSMGLQLWLRAKARPTLDGLFCSSSPDVQRIGDKDSGWVIYTSPMPRICYGAGVGKGISFDLENLPMTQCPLSWPRNNHL